MDARSQTRLADGGHVAVAQFGWVLILLTLFLANVFAAAPPRAEASLSDTSTRVGESVTLEIEAEGAQRPTAPTITIDGIDAVLAGQSYYDAFSPGRAVRKATYSFELTPKRQGNFTIPEIEVRVGNEVVKTKPIALKVGAGDDPKVVAELAFGELRVVRTSTWVGEWVVVDVRFFLSSEARWNPRQIGELRGEGYVSVGFKQPQAGTAEVSGRKYDTITYRTVVVPSKAGKLSLGPVKLTALVQRARGPAPYGIRAPGSVKEMVVETVPLELDVKPLPVAGRPAAFGGAIGKFKFDATGTPASVKVGEPVEMTMTITGSGNFDRLSEPPLADPAGWQTYPAKKEVRSSDEVATTGALTFRQQVVPTTKQAAMPVFAFVYFDPEAGKYVTLKNTPAALSVVGEALPSAPATTASNATEPTKPKPQDDIRPLSSVLSGAVANYAPALSTRALFALIAAPVPLLIVWIWLRSLVGNPERKRRAELLHERTAILSRVRSTQDRAELLDAAAHVLQLDAAISTGKPAVGIELPQILAARRLSADAVQAVQVLFNSRAEAVYAGGSRGGEAISSSERDRVIDTISSYERSRAS